MTDKDTLFVKTIFECGSITRAAEELFISQSSLTVTLRNIESRYGQRLFFREPRGIRITLYGQMFLDAAENIWKLYQLLLDDVSAPGKEVRFDTKLLERFCLCADMGSFQKASELLKVNRTSLYRNIRMLEKSLGKPLLLNESGQLSLTPVGKTYYKYAREILLVHSDLLRKLHPRSPLCNDLSVGMGSIRAQQYIPLILPRFCAKFPDAELHVHELNTLDLSLALKSHQVDITVTSRPLSKKGIRYESVRTDRLVMVAPKNDPLTAGSSFLKNGAPHISLSDFKDQKFLTGRPGQTSWGLFEALFAAVGFRPQVVFQCLDDYLVAKLAYQGLGYALIPEGCARIADMPLPHYYLDVDVDCTWTIGIATRTEDSLSPAGKYFVALLREAILSPGVPAVPPHPVTP